MTGSCELLVGSAAFWDRADADIRAAKQRALAQAMTFEGDSAGLAVGRAIDASTAPDRRVLVDDYSRHVINDRFVAARSFRSDPILVEEARATRAMFDGLVSAGVGVRVTNPIGRNPARYAVRNHKKLIVADDIGYIGGINFSDHNFAWHDMMLRIRDPQATQFLVEDFGATWAGRPVARKGVFGDLTLYALDGRSNRASFADLFAAIAHARATIDIVSAYPTAPFVDALGKAAADGVKVRIFTPLPNNKPIVRDYLIRAAERRGIAVVLLPDMTHLKAMVIDGRLLVAGSSNFDFASFHVEEEFLAFSTDPGLIEDFTARVIAPAELAALPTGIYRPSRLRATIAETALLAASGAVRALRSAARGSVDW